MDAVKIYWSDKIFLLGVFLCIMGTVLGAFSLVKPAVLVEIFGIILMMFVIFKVDNNEKNN
jgi:hypothetical protein